MCLGVGQVVVHVAGDSRCKKCVGIEKAEIPSKYADVITGMAKVDLTQGYCLRKCSPSSSDG